MFGLFKKKQKPVIQCSADKGLTDCDSITKIRKLQEELEQVNDNHVEDIERILKHMLGNSVEIFGIDCFRIAWKLNSNFSKDINYELCFAKIIHILNSRQEDIEKKEELEEQIKTEKERLGIK